MPNRIRNARAALFLLLRRVIERVYEHPKLFLISTAGAFAAIWGVLEPMVFGLGIQSGGWLATSIFVLIGFGFGGYYVAKPLNIVMRMVRSELQVNVRFGDIFDCSGIIVIPVNDFFDTSTNRIISSTSLHGQFLDRMASEGVTGLYDQIISNIYGEYAEVVEREEGQKRRYNIGATSFVNSGMKEYLLVALSHTDSITHKVSSTIYDHHQTLNHSWERAQDIANGREISVPLIGNGLSGVDLRPEMLINVLLVSMFCENRKKKIGGTINIV